MISTRFMVIWSSSRQLAAGDVPESVNQALHEAVTKNSWSRDPNTLKLIFLVGDAPPHMDYPDDVRFPEIIQLAVRAGIVINTIQCGHNAPDNTDLAGNCREVRWRVCRRSISLAG